MIFFSPLLSGLICGVFRCTISKQKKKKVLILGFKWVDKATTRSFLVDSNFGTLEESNGGLALASAFSWRNLIFFLFDHKKNIDWVFSTISAKWLVKTMDSNLPRMTFYRDCNVRVWKLVLSMKRAWNQIHVKITYDIKKFMTLELTCCNWCTINLVSILN